MKRKILQGLVLVMSFVCLQAGMVSFANTEELDEELMQQAMKAYKTGVSLYRSKAYDSALASFQEALKYNPKMTDAYYNIASIQVAKKNYDEAYKTYVKIIALNPRDYDSILQAAKISYNRKNYSLAMKYLEYIPEDYEYFHIAHQMYRDAKTLFDAEKNKIERAKITTANENKRILIDKFNSPAGMVVDSEGNMFVASYSDNAIVKIDKKKNRTNFIKDYLLDGPIGMAIDAYDNIYIANYDANNILKVTKGGSVSVFMEKVSQPYFLYIKNEVLYISEQGNDVVLTYNLANTK